MARFLYLATAGTTDDPTRAALPLILARGAIEAGHDAEVCFVGGAVRLLDDEVARTVQPPGWPRLQELLAIAVTDGVLLHACQRGERPGGLAERDLMAKNALMLDVDRAISI